MVLETKSGADAPKTPAATPKLPIAIVTRSDVANLGREAEAIENVMKDAALRNPQATPQPPKTSHLYDELLQANKLNVSVEADRAKLVQFLEHLRTKAPLLHVGFNADPSALFQQRLVAWIREQIHPQVLLQIGLYPSIGAGCVVRTNNHYYDFSLRQRFTDQRELLISKIKDSSSANQPVRVAVRTKP